MTQTHPKLRLVAKGKPPRAAILSFQPDATELEEMPPPRMARVTLYAVVVMIGLALTWSILATLDEVVIAKGKLVTTTPSLVVQPLEASIIREIAVKPGDHVVKGAVLARLDPTFASADSRQLETRLRAQDAEIARLEAELAGIPYVVDAAASSEALSQAQLYERRQAFYNAKLRDYDSQIAEAETAINAADREETLLTSRLDGLHQIDDIRQTLMDSGRGSRLVYLQARDLSLDAEASLARNENERLLGAQRLERAKSGLEAFTQEFHQTATERLIVLREQRGETVEEMRKATLREDMSVLRAPADAIVLDAAPRSVGSVVQPAEAMFTLVPAGVALEAEVAVEGQDVARLKAGDPVRIKFDAFPFQKHGTTQGQIRVISQDAFVSDQNGGGQPAFYRLRVALDPLSLRNLPPGFTLIPGMGMQAEIKSGERSVISYFLYPLLRGFDESFREP